MRISTESWVSSNLYCPVCESDTIEETPPNTKVIDFLCPKCYSTFQLKSKKNAFGKKIVDSAYESMINAINNDSLPHLVLLSYLPKLFKINNLMLIPNFCLSASAIEQRKPLSQTARRAGWVGCNIILDSIPSDVRIDIISSGHVISRETVREKFRSAKPLKNIALTERGWTLDVLTCVRSLKKQNFNLNDVYMFESSLSEKHPDNNNVRPKIRQQLQVLRDLNFLEFMGNGIYRMKS